MERKQKIRIGFAPLAIAAIVAPMALTNCDTLDAVCCKDFKPGTNMASVDWGLDASANAEYGASIQAIGDFSATAAGMVNDLGVACKGLAIDLGVDETSADATAAATEKDPAEQSKKWCAIAIKATADITAQASLKIDIQEPRCEVNVSAKLDCQASCSAQAKCELSPGEIKASCEAGKLSGQCSANCTGSCEGSASVAVTCDGQCSGECDGTCEGTASSGQCAGTCSGKCRGSCAIAAMAGAKCEATCSGGCDVDFKAPKCNGTFTPPSGKCEASANCKGSCDASASAKAECTPPSIAITASAGFDVQVAALQKWLPQIFLIIKGRFGVLTGQIEGLGKVAADLTASVSAGGKAAFCIIPAAEAVGDAGTNIEASGEVTAGFVGAIK